VASPEADGALSAVSGAEGGEPEVAAADGAVETCLSGAAGGAGSAAAVAAALVGASDGPLVSAGRRAVAPTTAPGKASFVAV